MFQNTKKCLLYKIITRIELDPFQIFNCAMGQKAPETADYAALRGFYRAKTPFRHMSRVGVFVLRCETYKKMQRKVNNRI